MEMNPYEYEYDDEEDEFEDDLDYHEPPDDAICGLCGAWTELDCPDDLGEGCPNAFPWVRI